MDSLVVSLMGYWLKTKQALLSLVADVMNIKQQLKGGMVMGVEFVTPADSCFIALICLSQK